MSTGNNQQAEPERRSDEKHTDASSHTGSIEARYQQATQYTQESKDDWITDPDNARNWTSRRKWTATAIVG
jgi:hypothetical protein